MKPDHHPLLLVPARAPFGDLPPFGHGGGGFTVDNTRRVYGRGQRRDEHFRVRDGVASGPGRQDATRPADQPR